MPKHQEIHNLAGSLIECVTQKYGNLTGLFSTAYTYNDSFPNQLLIIRKPKFELSILFS